MDTKKACIEFMKRGVDAIVFVGGDGTARDVYSVVKDRVAILGVPAGVKMCSGVFAFTPRMAAEVIANFDGSVDVEIIDIDEEAFRKDKLELKIYGYAKTFGGNVQQISWQVIKKVGKEGIIVVATPRKLALLKNCASMVME